MASENIKERKIYRVLIDELNRVWERIYFLTNARSVDADDGENLETKVGAIKGITTSTTVTENGWAADAKAVNESINALKKSVADGKSAIASAITSKGVSTAADATFAAMTDNIRSISTKPRVRDLGNGYSFNVSGICPNYRELTADNFVVDCKAGAHTVGDGTEDNPNIHWSARFHGFGITKNYNPNTGIFTITNYGASVSLVQKGLSEQLQTGSFNLTCSVKVVY